ncbi:MAG: hypothetical protein U0136_03035 [Bdellovibrionota bacterium]
MTDERAPILMNMPGQLRFSKDGRWFHEEVEFTHEKIRDYFSRHFHFHPALDKYVVEVDGKCIPVIVEDTSVVIRSLDTRTIPWTAILGNGAHEPFRAETLSVTAEPVYYSLAQNGERARLLGAAVQALLPFVVEREDGIFVLKSGPNEHVIAVQTTR